MAKYATVEQVREARRGTGLTVLTAGPIIGYSARAWEEWESGRRRMRLALLESFKQKLKEIQNA